MRKAELEQYLRDALVELAEGIEQMLAETNPHTPLPRPRVFKIQRRFLWPRIDGRVNWWVMVGRGGWPWYEVDPRYFHREASNPAEGLVKALLQASGCQPARVIQAAAQIRAAAEWCRKRAEGRRRHAEEILRQQRRAVEKIETDRALKALSKS